MPLGSVAINVIEESVTTRRGNGYLLVSTDRLIKLTETVTMKELSAEEVAKHFVNE